jgi:hypothetical protein
MNLPVLPQFAVASIGLIFAMGMEKPVSGIPKRLTHSYPPSLLAKKLLCLAYLPRPFDKEQLLKFLGLHAMNMLRVLKHYYRSRLWVLLSLEHAVNGCRIDLLLLNLVTGIIRLVEVKTSKLMREVFRIQAALCFPYSGADEAAVSNGETEELLTQSFIHEILAKKKIVEEILTEDPQRAARTYTPDPDACYTCGNMNCPYLQDRPHQ